MRGELVLSPPHYHHQLKKIHDYKGENHLEKIRLGKKNKHKQNTTRSPGSCFVAVLCCGRIPNKHRVQKLQRVTVSKEGVQKMLRKAVIPQLESKTEPPKNPPWPSTLPATKVTPCAAVLVSPQPLCSFLPGGLGLPCTH